MNDVWVIDATKKSTSVTDKVAKFDGVDDVISIELPAFVGDVSALGTIWLDVWLNPQSKGAKTILFDAYNGFTPMLRWYMESEGEELFVVLVMSPGKAQEQVKKWGPIEGKSTGVACLCVFVCECVKRVFVKSVCGNLQYNRGGGGGGMSDKPTDQGVCILGETCRTD